MIILKDFTEQEIEDEIRWMTSETKWMEADTPWESIEPADADELRKEMSDLVKEDLEGFVQSRKEIFIDDHHIGFVSMYPLDTSEYGEILPLAEKEEQKIAVGIEICESSSWNKGYGTEALKVWIDHCFQLGFKEVYMETWSGNNRMIRCAEKCGFKLIGKIMGTHTVGEMQVDSMLYRVVKD